MPFTAGSIKLVKMVFVGYFNSMNNRTPQRILLSLILVLVLIPVLGGVFCHCAHAETSNELRIERVMCPGCCPQSITLSDHQAILTETSALLLRPAGNLQMESLSARINPSGAQVLQDGARGLFGDTPPASFTGSTPLYLLNLVLRF